MCVHELKIDLIYEQYYEVFPPQSLPADLALAFILRHIFLSLSGILVCTDPSGRHEN